MALAKPRLDDTPFTVDHFERWAYDIELDTGEPWVVEAYFLLFLEDYFAGIPEAWLLVPEANAKTTNLAGLAVYLNEFRRRPAILWAASSRDQAEIGYRQAEGMVLSTPRLKRLMKCQEGYRRIKNETNNGRIQIFAADDRTGDGVIPTDAFLDELHRHRSLTLYRTWRGKLEKRGGQLGTISTAGEPGGDFEETREQIRQEVPVIDKRPGFTHCRNEHIAFHEYAVPEGGDVEDMATVKLANPFSVITEQTLANKFATPTMSIAHWRRFVCNLATRSEFAAIQEEEWFAAKARKPIPAGEPIWLGLDVAWKWDTTAAVPLWIGDNHHRQFGPAEVLTPPRDGTSLDPAEVERAIIRIHERNPIHTVAMDTNRAEQLGQWIESEIGATVLDVSQGIPVQVEEYEKFMEALRNGWLTHAGDVELTRHALNAVARIQRGGDAIFERPHQSRGAEQDRRVIDALKAAAMVHRVAMMAKPSKKLSRYNTPGSKLTVL